MNAHTHKLGQVALNRALLRCPDCAAPMYIRSSEQITETIKHLLVQCSNVDCTASFKWGMEPIHQINPSHIPNPAISIPPCPSNYVRRPVGWMRGQSDSDPNQMLMFPLDEAGSPPDDTLDPATERIIRSG